MPPARLEPPVRTAPLMHILPPTAAFARSLATLVFLTVLAGLSAQQRPLVDITPGGADHRDAIQSRDGQWVAYRTGSSIGVVSINGQAPVTVHSGSAAGGFLWAPTSGSLFLAEAGRIETTPRTAANATVLANFGSATVNLWDINAAGTMLYCTRYDPATSTNTAFAQPTSGGGAITLFTTQEEVFELRIDPTANFLLHLERSVAPFSPISVKRTDLTTSQVTDLVPGPLGTFVADPAWLDAGDCAVVTAQDAQGRVQVLRLDRSTQTAVALTTLPTHQRTSVSPDRAWILCESIDGLGGNGPALLPAAGGGEVLLLTREPFAWAGRPSMDALARTVVFSARRINAAENLRIFRLDLDREMIASPRCTVGSVLDLQLPAAATEIGAIFIGLRQPPFVLLGIAWEFDLGGSFAILTIAAGGPTPITVPIPVPGDPALRGLMVDFQGFRTTIGTSTAAFTRSGRFFIF